MYDKEVCDFIPKQHNSTTNLPTRGHKVKIFVQRAEKILRQNFLSIQAVKVWNSLPESIVESQTVNIFERRLDEYWKEHEMKFNFTVDGI